MQIYIYFDGITYFVWMLEISNLILVDSTIGGPQYSVRKELNCEW